MGEGREKWDVEKGLSDEGVKLEHHSIVIHLWPKVLPNMTFSTENCVDVHMKKDPGRVALIWEKDEPGDVEHVTYM